MIIQRFDNGWGAEFPWKQYEQKIVEQATRFLAVDNSRTVIINSVWYTKEYHQQVLNWLRSNIFDTIVLVAMLDAAIPQKDWYNEFDCRIETIGYYPGNYYIDQCALFVNDHYQLPDVEWLMNGEYIDKPFMCLNRKPHWHRKRLYRKLCELNLHRKGIVSMGSDTGVPVQELDSDCEHDKYAPNAEKNHYGVPNDVASLGNLDNWRRHFVNVVTETFWHINHTNFVTEKLFKPIVGCRPFLIYDPDGGTTWLKAQGFEPYTNDFKDISNFDPADADQLTHFLNDLSAQPASYWQKKFIDLGPKILYNKNHFAEYVQRNKNIIKKGIPCQI